MWLNLTDVRPLLHTNFVGRRIVYLTSTSSTQDVARREAEEGAPEGTLVIAEAQTAGRGRFKRKWVSPAGLNLYLTLVLRPDIERLRSLSLVGPLAVCRAVEQVTAVRPLIKWPNDVQVEGRKLSGVLVESEFSGSEPRFALVGIGVNVNYKVTDPEIAHTATSLVQEAGKEVSREKLLGALLNHFEELYSRSGSGRQVYEAWKQRLDTLGRTITVRFRDEAFEGVAEDVDGEGNLRLRLADGNVMTFEAGEVSLRA